MKKASVLLAALVLSLSLGACSNSTNAKQAEPSNTTVKKAKHNKHYQKDGQLTKVDNYTNDSSLGKITLKAINNRQKKFKVSSTEYTFYNEKIFYVEPKTQEQLDYMSNVLNTSLPKNYYYLQIDYTEKNNSAHSILSYGVNIIKPSGEQVKKGFQDEIKGHSIQPGAKVTTTFAMPVSKSDINKISQFKFVSGLTAVYGTGGNIEQKTLNIGQ